jgi:hypothetical protein
VKLTVLRDLQFFVDVPPPPGAIRGEGYYETLQAGTVVESADPDYLPANELHAFNKWKRNLAEQDREAKAEHPRRPIAFTWSGKVRHGLIDDHVSLVLQPEDVDDEDALYQASLP